jgi:glutamate dehydrogenase (NADP+)
MVNIFNACKDASDHYGCPGNYVAGANIAAFRKLAKSMRAQGIV